MSDSPSSAPGSARRAGPLGRVVRVVVPIAVVAVAVAAIWRIAPAVLKTRACRGALSEGRLEDAAAAYVELARWRGDDDQVLLRELCLAIVLEHVAAVFDEPGVPRTFDLEVVDPVRHRGTPELVAALSERLPILDADLHLARRLALAGDAGARERIRELVADGLGSAGRVVGVHARLGGAEALSWARATLEAGPGDPLLAIEILGQLGSGPEDLDVLVALFETHRDGSESWEAPRRLAIVRAIAELGRRAWARDRARAVLGPLADDARPAVALAAIAGLLDLGDAAAADRLAVHLPALGDASASAQAQSLALDAAHALDRAGDPRGLDALLAPLGTIDPDGDGSELTWPRLAWLAAERDPPAREIVLDVIRPFLERGVELVYWGRGLELLGETGSVEELPLLWPFLSARDSELGATSTSARDYRVHAAAAALAIIDRPAVPAPGRVAP